MDGQGTNTRPCARDSQKKLGTIQEQLRVNDRDNGRKVGV